MHLDPEPCYRALSSRDARFDGVFFVGVSTTGIYCRPICPARVPARERCTFFRSAAEAEAAGYRACFRCRPEIAPGPASLDSMSRLVAQALSRIEQGALEGASLETLATSLGVSARHLRRALQAELGVSPSQLVRTRRLALAKQLLHDTTLPITRIAHVSGFGSLRRFNAAFRAAFDRTPSALRAAAGTRVDGLVVTLGFRAPFDWPAISAFLQARALVGVEAWTDGAYLRTARLGVHRGWLRVSLAPRRDALRVEVAPELSEALLPLVARVGRMFDLGARPDLVAAHLARDPVLRDGVRRRPAQRVVGAFDAHELAVFAVLGQQISVAAARTLGARLVARLGEPVDTPFTGLSRSFPTPDTLARVPVPALVELGIPSARASALVAVAELFRVRAPLFEPGADPGPAIAALTQIRGVGEWTAQYVAMRALGWPDAFPAGDLGVRRALGGVKPRAALERAERWRPWRAYAVMHLWQGAA